LACPLIPEKNPVQKVKQHNTLKRIKQLTFS